MSNIQDTYRQYREDLLHERTRQELEIAAFAESLKNCDMKIFEGEVEFPEEISLRSFIPEFYEENMDPDKYEEQYKRAKEFFDKVNSIMDRKLEECRKCLQEYRLLASD